MGLKQGVIPQSDLKKVNELADLFRTFSSNIKYNVGTYEELRKACKLLDTGMDHLEDKYPDIHDLTKIK